MRVSFIIPALNEEQHLPACLRSLQLLERPGGEVELEVIVVDNQSRDRTAAIAREHGAKVVMVTTPGRVSRMRNLGAKESTGDLLAFIDADCELSRDWLCRLTAHFGDSMVVGAGACMAQPAASATWVETTWHTIAHPRQGMISAQSVMWLPSFNLLVRRDAFERVGGFDERLITCEDSDLGYKLSTGGKLILDNIAQAAHHGESRTLREFFRREAWRSRGNLRSWLQRKMAPGELKSILIPPAFLGGLSGGLILLALSAWWPALTTVSLALLLLTTTLPVLVLARRRISPTRLSLFSQGLTLVSLYLCARAIGLFLPMPRVGR